VTSKCVGIVGCVVVTFLSSIVVLIPNDNFLVLPLLYSLSVLFHVCNPGEKLGCL